MAVWRRCNFGSKKKKKTANEIENVSFKWGDEPEYEASVIVWTAEKMILIRYARSHDSIVISFHEMDVTPEPVGQIDSVLLYHKPSDTVVKIRFASRASKDAFLERITIARAHSHGGLYSGIVSTHRHAFPNAVSIMLPI